MRNGNEDFERYMDEEEIIGSYPTYEEWKHTSYNVYKLLICVLILPMRNGNMFCNDGIFVFVVLILPMRNGNASNNFILCSSSRLGSYPTYEEWKPDTFEVP